MRISASVTAVSWIPAGTVEGMAKVPFSLAVTHSDERPPSRLGDLNSRLRQDRFREANQLNAWIEVQDGRIVEHRGALSSPDLSQPVPGLALVNGLDDARADPERRGAAPGRQPVSLSLRLRTDGQLAAETGATDFRTWFSTCFGRHTPWGGRELEPLALNELAGALPRAS